MCGFVFPWLGVLVVSLGHIPTGLYVDSSKLIGTLLPGDIFVYLCVYVCVCGWGGGGEVI